MRRYSVCTVTVSPGPWKRVGFIYTICCRTVFIVHLVISVSFLVSHTAWLREYKGSVWNIGSQEVIV